MTAGRVKVNGRIACELGTKVDPLLDLVEVDGVAVALSRGKAYLMLNKPRAISTHHARSPRKAVRGGLIPVDKMRACFRLLGFVDTATCCCFTTDGGLGQDLLHPSKHVWKTYVALVDGDVRDGEFGALAPWHRADDGPCQPARCRIVSKRLAAPVVYGNGSCTYWLCRGPGSRGPQNQVKRMLAAYHPRAALAPLPVWGS